MPSLPSLKPSRTRRREAREDQPMNALLPDAARLVPSMKWLWACPEAASNYRTTT